MKRSMHSFIASHHMAFLSMATVLCLGIFTFITLQSSAQKKSADTSSGSKQSTEFPVSSSADVADAGETRTESGRVPSADSPLAILYDQNNNASSFGTNSQNFETANDAFDDAVADDFVVPSGVSWTVNQVFVDGQYYNGTGPASSVNVVFYSNTGSLPGAVVATRNNSVIATDVAGDFTINISPNVVLVPGTYWVSVQANQNFTPNGQWAWTDRTIQSNSAAAFINPGGGFNQPTCTATFGLKTTCVSGAGGPDNVFQILGTSAATTPTITKAFGAATMPLNGTTSLTVTISNPSGVPITNVAFSDTFPAGLGFANPVGLASTCGGVTVAATGPPATLNLSGGSVAAGGSCTVSANVTGTTAGTKVNTTGTLTWTGGTGNTATASILVVAPPVISKSFTPSTIALNGTSNLAVTITNPNAGTTLNNVAFTDTFPAGLVTASPSALSGNCGGVSVTTAGSLSLSGGVLAGGASCTISVNVTATTAGTKVNTTGAVSSTEGGTGNTATANLIVNSPDLSITKVDGVATAPAGSTVTYTIVATNNGPGSVIGATVADTFPAAIINAQWTCAASAGSSCGALSGSGNINQAVNILAGGTVTYTVAATISPSATGTMANTATVSYATGTDPNPANNTSTDTDTLTAPSSFVIDDAVTKLEGQSGTTAFVFTVTKLGGTGFATAVQYQTFDGTATAPSDYTATSGTLNFGPNETQKTITVLVNGDTTIEPNETFFVRLSNNPVNALIGDGEGQGTIQNDDPAATPTPTPIPTPTPVPTPTPTPANRFEGDINRTAVGVPGTGDGDVTVADQIQYLRFLNGTDCPSTNEQPRLDAGPRATLGDGSLGAADGTAIDAYARHDALTDFDPNTPGWQPTPVGGNAAISNLGCTPSAAPEGDTGKASVVEPASATAARVVRVVSRSGARNADILVDVEMTAQGNEAGTQYGLHFDPSVLAISSVSGVNTNPDVMLGAGAPAGTTLNVNADDAVNGNIGIVENFSAAALTALPEGSTRIARVKFHVLDTAAAGTSKVDFDSSVISGATSDINGFVLSSNYEGGDVSVSSSRGVTVTGRVTSSDGRGIRGATVTIVDGDGFARSVTTSSFGYYTFDDVAAATYTVAVSSRQYRYASRVVTVGDNLADVNFTGLE